MVITAENDWIVSSFPKRLKVYEATLVLPNMLCSSPQSVTSTK